MRGTTTRSPDAQAATQGVGADDLVVGDRQAHAHPAALVDVRARPRQLADRADHLGEVVRHLHVDAVDGARPSLLAHDVHLRGHVERVVGADLAAEAVLQRRDDAAAVGVVLGVRRGHQQDVEGQADLVAAHLDVALLEHVEQADLDAFGEVGQLVDGEDAAVGPRDEAVVQRQLVGQVATLGDLDRVDLADQVGDRRVRRRQLLAEAGVAVDPRDRRVLAVLGDEVTGVPGHRRVRVVVDLAAGDDRHPLVEQAGQRADDAGLRLTALAQEDDVVAGEQGVLELREDGLLVAEDAVEQRLTGGDAGDGVGPDLFLDRARPPAGLPELTDRCGACCHGPNLPLRRGAARSLPGRRVSGGAIVTVTDSPGSDRGQRCARSWRTCACRRRASPTCTSTLRPPPHRCRSTPDPRSASPRRRPHQCRRT